MYGGVGQGMASPGRVREVEKTINVFDRSPQKDVQWSRDCILNE